MLAKHARDSPLLGANAHSRPLAGYQLPFPLDMDSKLSSPVVAAHFATQQAVLEAIAAGAALDDVFVKIISLVELLTSRMQASIVLLDAERRIRHVVAPTLPAELARALHGEKVDYLGGAGSAAAWEPFRSIAPVHGLHAGWSMPIHDPSGNIRGVLATYLPDVQVRTEAEVFQRLESAAHLAYIAIAHDRIRCDEADRARMREALRCEEQLRSVIFDTVEDAIFYVRCEPTGDYRFVSVNRAFTQMFGVTKEFMSGRPLLDVLPDATRETTLNRYRNAALSGEHQRWDEVMMTNAGERHGEITIIPIFDVDGRCMDFVGTVHDITPRVQAERERAQLQLELAHSQRMQALGALAGGIAHDFNNILAAIGGNTNLLLSEVPAESPWRQYLLDIHKATGRAVNLVRQILTFGRSEALERKVFDPRAILDEVLVLLRTTLPPGVDIDVQVAPDSPCVVGDPTQFHQVLLNLLTNAVRAMEGRSGHVGVQLDRVNHEVAVNAASAQPRAAEDLRLRVWDCGCGMDASTLARVFEPFFTTRTQGEGTGLGLPVVHSIVKNHGGSIKIESTLGHGTCITVWLPASTYEPDSSNAAAKRPRSAMGHGQHIMYVDDEQALVLLMSRTLTKLGYRITGHTDPETALQCFSANPTAFDVVVSDCTMPTMPGTQLAEKIRELRRDIPIILTSGYIRSEDHAVAQRLHINQIIYKSNTVDELADALAEEIWKLSSASNQACNSPVEDAHRHRDVP